MTGISRARPWGSTVDARSKQFAQNRTEVLKRRAVVDDLLDQAVAGDANKAKMGR